MRTTCSLTVERERPTALAYLTCLRTSCGALKPRRSCQMSRWLEKPMIENRAASEPDVVLVGAVIMSATLGVFLKELEPTLNITMVETLDGAALESSDAWNNAGTGHAANCELNYTPERSDGSIDISKALDVNVEFDLSRQFWSYLVTKGAIADPQSFIHPVPHMSFVHGPDNVAFLKKRFAAMSAHHCYYGMEYTEDKKKLSE